MNRPMDSLFNNIRLSIMFLMVHIHMVHTLIMRFIIQHTMLLDTRHLQLWIMQPQVSSMSTVHTSIKLTL